MVVSFYDAKASGFFFILTNSVKGRIVFVFHIFLSFSYNLRSHIALSLSLPSLSVTLSLSRICIEFHRGVKVVLKPVSPVAVLFLQLDHIVDS